MEVDAAVVRLSFDDVVDAMSVDEWNVYQQAEDRKRESMTSTEWYWYLKARDDRDVIWWDAGPPLEVPRNGGFFWLFSMLWGDVIYKWMFFLDFKDHCMT